MLRYSGIRLSKVMVLFLFFSILGVVFNLSIFATGAEETKNPPLTLQDAVKITLEQGSDMRKATLDLQQSEVTYKQNKADLLLHPSILSQLSNETTLLVAQRNIEIIKANQIQTVEESYDNVLKAQRTVALARENVARSKKQLDNVNAKFSLGMVAQIDVLSAELELSKAETDQNNSESNLEILKMQLNRILGRDLKSPLELASELMFTPVDVDPEKSLEFALAHRLEIKKAEDALTLETKGVEVNANDFTPALVQKKSQVSLEQARLDLESTRQNITIEVRQNYETVKNAERNVPLQEKTLTKAKETLRIAEARFDAGVITSIELIDARNAVYQAENAYLQAVFDYNVGKAKFYNSLGMSSEERMKSISSEAPPPVSENPVPQASPKNQ
ncbi:MAG: TolC family protein [Candidatus Atribacteria bacterium]|nr:TolC family protein [Candidatus Atribacteria bacterium]